MSNLRMTVAYEGTNYAGFQRQANTGLTIQAFLEEGIARITGESVKLAAAGRTDAGVHARGQVISFHSNSALEPGTLQRALNSSLPPDILVLQTAEVAASFHARYSVKSKTYSYRIYNDRLRPLFQRPFVYHFRHALDAETMRVAALLLPGKKDFRAFQATGSPVKTTIRTIYNCRVEQDGPEIRLIVNADGFLYHMVRNIAGTLIMAGNGRLSLAGFQQVLEGGDRRAAGPTAPAQGLCLEEVFY
jgi:tRNA pseudouridine38-40 synthase